MKKILALALFSLNAVAPIAGTAAAAQSLATEQTVTFTVENMTCALCPVSVKRAMEGVEAIAAASANADYPALVEGWPHA